MELRICRLPALSVFVSAILASCASTFTAGQMPLETMPVPYTDKTETSVSLSGNISSYQQDQKDIVWFGQAGLLHIALLPHQEETSFIVGAGASAWGGQALLNGNTKLVSDAPSVPVGNYSGGLLPAQALFYGASLQGSLGYRYTNLSYYSSLRRLFGKNEEQFYNFRFIIYTVASWEGGDYLPLRLELDEIILPSVYNSTQPERPYNNIASSPWTLSANLELAWERALKESLHSLISLDIGVVVFPGTEQPYTISSGSQLQLRWKNISYVLGHRSLWFISDSLKLSIICSF